ncbi:hypothetical protein WJX73_007757 [Symbiochloris irregularis]|uniref:Uncharacterized protein n=1 Tax=Symbiochloris irregularis TaxID=706552 RepID=A0AAW1NVQ3_9CHLO
MLCRPCASTSSALADDIAAPAQYTIQQATRHLRNSASAAAFPVGPAFCAVRSCKSHARRAVTTQAAAEALVLSETDSSEYFREVSGGNAELNTAAPTDFYQLLSVDYDADAPAIRAAYRALQRIAHPDIAGDRAHELAILLNCAYATLSDPQTKQRYDSGLRQFRAEHMHYDGIPVSQWFGPPGEQRAVFVDESQCIGCMQCTWICPSTFFMEDNYGRARVSRQWADEADAVSEAMDLCPVDSIHYVRRDQLALLEFVMRDCERESTAILADRRSGNMSPAPNSHSPFERAAAFLRHRKEAHVVII